MNAIGFKIKSGYAIAVVLSGSKPHATIEAVRTVALCADEFPQSRFPYHPTIELSEREGALLSHKAVGAVRRMAASQMGSLLESFSGVKHAGIVVGSTIDPDKLGNPHVRVHALEGKLFREVVMEALERGGVDCDVLIERDAYRTVAGQLRWTDTRLRGEIATLGYGKIKPWRADEKLAALAAWRGLPGGT